MVFQGILGPRENYTVHNGKKQRGYRSGQKASGKPANVFFKSSVCDILPSMKFTDFNLDERLEKGIADAGYVTCMPVQEEVLKAGLGGRDLYVQSQTGSGKTAAYLVTVFQRMISLPEYKGKKALIMTPTRELAVQVEEEAKILSAHTDLKPASFYGGVGYVRQISMLKQGADVLIGTPGRVIDLRQSDSMDLSDVAFLVIDEADRMFDMGFYPDLRKLIKFLQPSASRQTMLFSATLNSWVKNLAWEYTTDPAEVTIEAENITVDEIDQQLFHVSSDEKMRLLCGIMRNENPESLIIFCNTKRMSEVVAKRLRVNGFPADFIIGDLPQSKRLQIIDSFKSGKLRYLVATDVAARGLDVDNLAMVINFDLPEEAENYVHRIGRTARAGKTGKAYSFCSEQDVYNLPGIERYIDAKIPVGALSDESFAEDKSAGMYIKIARYENDYSDDPGSQRRSASREKKASGRFPAGGGRFQADKEKTRRSASARKPSAGRTVHADEREQRDLSHLTLEERMRYYQKKYGGHSAGAQGENRRKPASAKGKPHTAGKGKKGAGKPQDRKRKPDLPPRTGAKHPARGETGKPAKPNPQKNRQSGGKGIKGWIKKLFGIRGK